ncbi:MAG: phenylalanine--tRNA ligase subunit alpha [Candidatus Nomurabacteria bacterium]|nr:phenylalanine--tRNA ligase subunit alpha [Candidatus Nomurabacteria bacterium]
MNDQSGKIHPISDIINQVSEIFVDLGFEIADGPEMEDQWHNFDALNIPANHPARDMQDTFFVKPDSDTAPDQREDKVMRTHTSNVQVRFMEKLRDAGQTPPFKIIAPGKVFRNEATDATHEVQFHQIEGLVVGEGVSIGHLKGALEHFLKKMFGNDVEMRLRPGFFPFVEPGVEVDLKFNGKWLELLGAGMVHPNVLENVGIDSKKYSGFAFGVGIDRLAMMKWGINDIRLFYQGDLRLHNNLK